MHARDGNSAHLARSQTDAIFVNNNSKSCGRRRGAKYRLAPQTGIGGCTRPPHSGELTSDQMVGSDALYLSPSGCAHCVSMRCVMVHPAGVRSWVMYL